MTDQSASKRDPRVLIVEDNPIDIHILQLVLRRAGYSGIPVTLDDGAPALALLCPDGLSNSESMPDLVILDIKLKEVDGPEVLSYIRGTESLRKLAVVILSSSPENLMRATAPQADGYFEKPFSLEEYLEIGKAIWDRFLTGHKPLSD